MTENVREALLEAELNDLKEEAKKMHKMLKKIADCDWCTHADSEEFDPPCIDCYAGSKFVPDYGLIE